MSRGQSRIPIPLFGGPHDGDHIRASADPNNRPTAEVARSHRTGAGPVRSRYRLAYRPDVGMVYLFVTTSEEMIQ